MQTKTEPAKPVTIKITRTDGGYAVFGNQASIQPTAVFTSPWSVVDWLVERLAELDPAGGLTTEPAGR